MNLKLDEEEFHHLYYYPYLSKILNEINDDQQRLFLCSFLIPPGFRPESTSETPSSVCFPAGMWFYSIEAFSFQLRFNLLPDPGFSLAVLADLLYRLLLCCLPTNQGGFTADTLLLNSGRSVIAWGKSIVHLIDCLDQRVARYDMKHVYSKHPVRDAFFSDLLSSTIQGITLNLYQYHLCHTNMSNVVIPLISCEEPPILGNRLRGVLLELLYFDTVQEQNDDQNQLFIDFSSENDLEKPRYRKHKVHQCIEHGDWQPICLSSSYRLPAHLLRLVAALQCSFFSEYQEYNEKLTHLLIPWVQLAQFLCWELAQLSTPPDVNQINGSVKTTHLNASVILPDYMETGFVLGLLIEALRGIISLIPLSYLTLKDENVCQRLLSVLESIFHLQLLSIPSSNTGKVVLALRQKQFEVLHELAFSLYTQTPKTICNAYLSNAYNAFDIMFMNDPSILSSCEKKITAIHQMCTAHNFSPCGFGMGLFASQSWNLFRTAEISTLNASCELVTVVEYLVRIFSDNSYVANKTPYDTPLWILNVKRLMNALINADQITLSIFSVLLAQHLSYTSMNQLVENLPVVQVTHELSLYSTPIMRIMWIIYHSFLYQNYEPPTKLRIIVIQSIYQTLCCTSVWDEQFYLTHLLLLTLQRQYNISDALGTLEISVNHVLQTALLWLQTRVENILVSNTDASPSGASLLLLRLTTQLVVHLCIAQQNSAEILSSATFQWIPITTLNVVTQLINMCRNCCEHYQSKYCSSFLHKAILSLLVSDGIVSLLNHLFLYILKALEYLTKIILDDIKGSTPPRTTSKAILSSTSESTSSIDVVGVLNKLLCFRSRRETLNSLWECVLPLFDIITPCTSHNDSNLMLAVLTPMVFFDLLFDGQETEPISLPLPPLIPCGTLGDVAFDTMSIQLKYCSMEISLKNRSLSYVKEFEEMGQFCLWWFEQKAQVELVVEPYEWVCSHTNVCSEKTPYNENACFSFYNYLKTHFSQFCKAHRHVSSLKEQYDQYWYSRLGPFCSVCMAPLPQSERLGFRIGVISCHERFQRFPSTLRLAAIMTGTYVPNLLLRGNDCVNITLSHSSVERFCRILFSLISYQNAPLVPDVQLGPLVSSSSLCVQVENLSEFLSLLIITAGIQLTGVSHSMFPLVHWCLTAEREWVIENNLCRGKLRRETLDKDTFRAQTVLLHLLESFTYLTLLIGLPLPHRSFFHDSLNSESVPNEVAFCQTALVIGFKPIQLCMASCQQSLQLLSLGYLSSEEVDHPVLLVWRRVLDLYRLVLVAPWQLTSCMTFRVSSYWDVTFPDIFTRLSAVRDTLRQILSGWSRKASDDPFCISDHSMIKEIQCAQTHLQQCNAKSELSQDGETTKPFIAGWLPSHWCVSFLIRGATPSTASDLVTYWISLLRRSLQTHCWGDTALLLDILNRTARSFGLSSFPAFLSQLDTRPLLTLLASSHHKEEYHLHLVLWWYGVHVKTPSLNSLLKMHMIRVGYHPFGRRSLQHIERVIGSLILPQQRGLMYVTNCSSWVSRSVPRITQKAHDSLDRLRDTWRTITKQLFPSVTTDKAFSDHIQDFKRSEKILRASTEVQLFLRELWDLSGPWAVFQCPTMNLIEISDTNLQFIESRLSFLNGGLDLHSTQKLHTLPLELTNDAFLQMWEMLRCLWGERHEAASHDLESMDLMMIKAFSAVEPLHVYGEIFSNTLDGGTLRRSLLFFTNPCHQQIISWRVCRTVHLFLTLLVGGSIKLHGVTNCLKSNPLDQHIALIVTLLESLSDASPAFGSLNCWFILLSHGSPSALHPFLPAIVRRLVELHSTIPTSETMQSRLLHVLCVGLDVMRKYEKETQGPLLSLFCEVDVINNIPESAPLLFPLWRTPKQLACDILYNAGTLLESPNYSSEVKFALLFSIETCFKSLHCHSLSHFHTIAELPFPSEYGSRLLNSCIHLASIKPSRRCPIDLLVGSVLGLCGSYPATTVLSSFVPDVLWWDSCSHFLAVRILERLIYPNLNNRVTLYYIQELLAYLDHSSTENQNLYHTNQSACCLNHDNPITEVSIMDFVSENVKRLGQGFKSSRYTLSVMVPTKNSMHPLQQLARMLLKHIPSLHREVFLRSGLEYSSYLPDVLRFLLPHLFLVALSHLADDDSDSAVNIAHSTVNVINEAKKHLETTWSLPGFTEEQEEIFLLYDPASTCQILFEVIDSLTQIFHTFRHHDRHNQLLSEKQSSLRPQSRQSLALSLSPHNWASLHTFLRITRGVDAASAAIKVGAFSRCLFYLETTFFSKNIPYGSEAEASETPKDILNQATIFVPMFVEAFHGLQNWDQLQGCSKTVDHCNDPELKSEQLALDLQAHHQPLATAWEYIRLAHYKTVKANVFYCKALRSLLNAQAFGTFLLEYGKAAETVKAVCLPLLMKSLWKSGLWNILEYLYSSYSDLVCTASATTSCLTSVTSPFSLKEWQLPSSSHYNSSHFSSQLPFVPSMFDLPSPREIFSASFTWSMQDRGDFLIGGVLSALHEKNFSLMHSRLERFSRNAVASLATTTRDTHQREYLALVPLRLSVDIQHIIDQKTNNPLSENAIIDRLETMMRSTPLFVDILDTLKVVSEELDCLRAASTVAIQLSKMFRKSAKRQGGNSEFHQVVLCGKYQLSDYLRLLSSSSPCDDSLLKNLSMELSKSAPQAMCLEVLMPLIHLDDKAAVRYAKLSVSTTHLLPEKLQMLQKVVEQHPHSERAHRCLAELLDTQIHNWTTRVFDSSAMSNEFMSNSTTPDPLEDLPNFPKGWSMISLVESAICHHLEAAAWSSSTRRARFHLLKFLQLLVDVFFCDESDSETKIVDHHSSRLIVSNYTSAQEVFVERIMQLTEERLARIPTSHWYLEVSQLVARCQHKQLGSKIFQPLLARLLQHRPQQMAWHLGPWFCSERSERHKTANSILSVARTLECQQNQTNSSALFIERTVMFISCLVTLAGASLSPITERQDVPMKSKMNITKEFPQLAKVFASITAGRDTSISILLPLLSQLDAIPEKLSATPIFIDQVDDILLVMRSKQRPKKLTLKGSDGLDYPWLVKRESRGDLRKDARLMEVAGYVNEWIEKIEKVKQKNLQIQRYSVIPLNEATGLIEWLPNLVTIRCAVLELWESQLGQEKFMNLMKRVVGRYTRHKQNPKALLSDFQETLHHFKPVLQKFFFDRFGTNVTVWYECRKIFSESLASWSVLGFIFGLGDRHGENILVNVNTGKVVHVDFDCLFGKGLQLPVPEVVPFRLTQNLIAALGFGGLKGGFLAACADTLDTIKQYEKDFLSVLQSFVFDPLIEWTRTTKGSTNHQEEDDTGGGIQARRFLQDVRTKLNGGVNCRSQKLLKPSSLFSTLGSQPSSPVAQPTLDEIYHYVTTWVVEPGITVETQVKELIEAACCHYNLSLMYLGWMPWV